MARTKTRSRPYSEESDPDAVLDSLIDSPPIRRTRTSEIHEFIHARRDKLQLAFQAGHSLNVVSKALANSTNFPKESLRTVLSEVFPEFKRMRRPSGSSLGSSSSSNSLTTSGSSDGSGTSSRDYDQDTGRRRDRSSFRVAPSGSEGSEGSEIAHQPPFGKTFATSGTSGPSGTSDTSAIKSATSGTSSLDDERNRRSTDEPGTVPRTRPPVKHAGFREKKDL